MMLLSNISNDIAQLIKDAKIFDVSKKEPMRAMWQAINADAAAIEQAGLNNQVSRGNASLSRSKDNLRQGLVKVYA